MLYTCRLLFRLINNENLYIVRCMGTGLAKVKKVKLQKIEALAKSGVAAYPDIKHRPTEIAEVKKRFDELVISQKKVRIAGRLMAKREHGGSTFVTVHDGSGTLQ